MKMIERRKGGDVTTLKKLVVAIVIVLLSVTGSAPRKPRLVGGDKGCSVCMRRLPG